MDVSLDLSTALVLVVVVVVNKGTVITTSVLSSQGRFATVNGCVSLVNTTYHTKSLLF